MSAQVSIPLFLGALGLGHTDGAQRRAWTASSGRRVSRRHGRHTAEAKVWRRATRDVAGTMQRMRESQGFTLIELLIAVAIMGIIAAMVIPGLLRARMAGNGASAVGSLRVVSSSQTGFAASCGGGFFAPSLAVLSAPPTVIGGDGVISNDLSADPSTKSSYSIALTPGALSPASPASCNGAGRGRTLVGTYYVGADPVGNGGIRFFGMNQGGTILLEHRRDSRDAVRYAGWRPSRSVSHRDSHAASRGARHQRCRRLRRRVWEDAGARQSRYRAR